MSYSEAKKFFDANIKQIELQSGTPKTPETSLMWNLSLGLRELVEALEADSSRLRLELDRLAKLR